MFNIERCRIQCFRGKRKGGVHYRSKLKEQKFHPYIISKTFEELFFI